MLKDICSTWTLNFIQIERMKEKISGFNIMQQNNFEQLFQLQISGLY